MSKFYIRVTDSDQDDTWYVGKIKSSGDIQRVKVANFAKRFDNYELAEAFADTLRRKRSDRDGSTVSIEVIDAATGQPAEMQAEPPELPDDAAGAAAEQVKKADYTPAEHKPVKVPEKDGEKWVPQVTFTFGADKRVELQMCRTPEGMRYRYVDEYGIPASRSDSWVASADAFFSYARWRYYTALIDYEAKKKGG